MAIPGNGDVFCTVTLSIALIDFIRLNLQGENIGFRLQLLVPTMAGLERRILPEGIAFGEPFSLSVQCQEMVDTVMVIVVVSRSLF